MMLRDGIIMLDDNLAHSTRLSIEVNGIATIFNFHEILGILKQTKHKLYIRDH